MVQGLGGVWVVHCTQCTVQFKLYIVPVHPFNTVYKLFISISSAKPLKMHGATKGKNKIQNCHFICDVKKF